MLKKLKKCILIYLYVQLLLIFLCIIAYDLHFIHWLSCLVIIFFLCGSISGSLILFFKAVEIYKECSLEFVDNLDKVISMPPKSRKSVLCKIVKRRKGLPGR